MIAIKYNGEWVELPAPDYNGGYTPATYDIDADGSGRDEAGYMHRDRVAIKKKLNCRWSNITQANLNRILQVIGGVFLEVRYKDMDGQIKEGIFYVGDREAPVYSYAIHGTLYASFTCNFIER